MSIYAICSLFSNYKKGLILVVHLKFKEEIMMSISMEEAERLAEENRKLKAENDMLLNVVVQMKVTLNRLVTRYVTEERD